MEFIGTILGNYRIDQLLGEGGMGAVYRAYDLTLQRDVAIKMIHPHFARRPEFRERFMQEARIMARLDHPGIVKVFLLGKEGDLLYLPMEFIKGGNLRQLLDELIREQKWLPLNEAILLMQQLCQVVEYAHKNGVLHRDIKPANLMLKPESTDGLPFRVVLTDLGLAKLLQGLGLTEEGTSLGTPAYMSPEQALGKSTDPRSDVYSLGILLYEMAVGRLPFNIRTLTEATRYHTQVPPPDPCSINPKVPETLQRIILKALEKDPASRYPSAAALGEVLAGTLSVATEIVQQVDPGGVSLITKYAESVVLPPGTNQGTASLMTVFGTDSDGSRGSSVFGGQSIPPSSDTRIQIIHKNKTAQVVALPSGTVTIGRGKGNSIVLDDEKVSRRHAQITWDGMVYHVMDLNSSNGTFLNNARLLPGISEILKPNQNLRIGDAWIRIVQASSKAPSVSTSRSAISTPSMYASSTAGVVGVSVSPMQLSVEAGGGGAVTVSLINQSPNVDHFTFAVTGIPNTWIINLPAGVPLMPGEQNESTFTFQVPRSPQSQAGPHPVRLRVSSQRDASQFVEVKLTLTVGAFSQFRTEIQPRRIRSGQTGRLNIFNEGNLNEVFTVQFADQANEIQFQPSQLQVRVQAGAAAAAEYQVRENRRRWIGGEKSQSFNAQISLPRGAPQTLQAEMISRGLIPAWLPPIFFLLCCLFAGGAMKFVPPLLFPTPTITTTPSLTLTPVFTETLTPSATAEIGAPNVDQWCVYPADQPPASFTDCPVQVSVELNKTLMIQWSVSNANEVKIEPFGNQPLSGTLTYQVNANTPAFSLIARNEANKEIQKTVQINVVIPTDTPTDIPTPTIASASEPPQNGPATTVPIATSVTPPPQNPSTPPITGVTLVPPVQPTPNAPTNFRIVSAPCSTGFSLPGKPIVITYGPVKLAWDDTAGNASSYRILARRDKDPFTVVGNISGTLRSYTINSTIRQSFTDSSTAEIRITFGLEAINSGGTSPRVTVSDSCG